MKYKFDLENKVAVITGAAGSIGEQVAIGFLENGADVILIDYNEAELIKKTESLKKEFTDRKILCITADLTDVKAIEESGNKIKENFDRVDILVNNAGTGKNIRSIDETQESWDKVIDLNLTSTFFVSQMIAKNFMIPQRVGKIINMCSLSAILGIPNSVSYSASKGGVLQLTKSLAAEWARFNIQVNSVCPGFVDTPLIAESKSDERWLGYVVMRNPMKRLAESEDIVGPTLFLASNFASYITGTQIVVDGGFSCSG